jgi:hypothetical protein
MATLFSLAERGVISIEEQAHTFGKPKFVVRRSLVRTPLANFEERMLDLFFGAGHGSESSVTLAKGRASLASHFGKFSAAVREEMSSRGFTDEGRIAIRRRFVAIAVAAFVTAGLSAVLIGLVAVGRFGPWPMLIPAALVAVAVAALICYGGHTPLSNDGVRRAERWRAFRAHLRAVSRAGAAGQPDETIRQWLPYAVAAGLAPAWVRFVKRHPGITPDWFRTLSSHDGPASFAAFLASSGPGGGANGAHGASAGAGASAGGGASGAH